MMPSYRPNQLVVVSHGQRLAAGDVVVAYVRGREVIKRVDSIENGKVFLLGDNRAHSTDSRDYGWVADRHVTGRIVWPRSKNF